MANRLGADIVSDSDSSQFSWITDEKGNRVRNPEFPYNYIEHLKEVNKTHRYVFASTHKSVLDALHKSDLLFTLVHPRYDLKEEWLQRYDARKENGFPRKVLEDNWDQWFTDMNETCPHSRIVLEHGEYLDDRALVPNGASFGPGNVKTSLFTPWRAYSDALWSYRQDMHAGRLPLQAERLRVAKEAFEDALHEIPMPTEESMAKESREYCNSKIGDLRTCISNLKYSGVLTPIKADLLLNVIHFVCRGAASDDELVQLSNAMTEIRLARVRQGDVSYGS